MLKIRMVSWLEYQELEVKDSNTLYYLFDTSGLMKGNEDFNILGIEVVIVNSFEDIEYPTVNTLYVKRDDLSAKTYNGNNFDDVILPISSLSDLMDLEISPDIRIEAVLLTYSNETKKLRIINLTTNTEKTVNIATDKKIVNIGGFKSGSVLLYKPDGSAISIFIGTGALISGINIDGKVTYKHPMIGDVFTDYSMSAIDAVGAIEFALESNAQYGNIMIIGDNGEPQSSQYSIGTDTMTGKETVVATEKGVQKYTEEAIKSKVKKTDLVWHTSVD